MAKTDPKVIILGPAHEGMKGSHRFISKDFNANEHQLTAPQTSQGTIQPQTSLHRSSSFEPCMSSAEFLEVLVRHEGEHHWSQLN